MITDDYISAAGVLDSRTFVYIIALRRWVSCICQGKCQLGKFSVKLHRAIVYKTLNETSNIFEHPQIDLRVALGVLLKDLSIL